MNEKIHLTWNKDDEIEWKSFDDMTDAQIEWLAQHDAWYEAHIITNFLIEFMAGEEE